jgi:hypothetical protein
MLGVNIVSSNQSQLAQANQNNATPTPHHHHHGNDIGAVGGLVAPTKVYLGGCDKLTSLISGRGARQGYYD